MRVCIRGQPGRLCLGGQQRYGIQDAGESGLAGVSVELHKSSDDSLVSSTTTDATGIYGFTVNPDSYYVTFVLPGGYIFSPTGAGTPATDSNADTTTGGVEQ